MAGALPVVLAGLILSAVLHRAGAQSGPYCTSDVAFLKNPLGQDPCHVAAYLVGQCWEEFPYTLTTLGTTYSGYGGPDNSSTEFWQSNGCMCSGPVYNLLSACQDCQGKAVFPYSEYTTNCSQTFTGSAITPTVGYNSDVPNGTQIPSWAFVDNSAGGWTRQQAQDNVTASVPNTPVSDVASGSTSGSGGGHRDVGAIVGGTIGGLAGVGAIGLLALWFARNHEPSTKGWKGEKAGAGAGGGGQPYQGGPAGGAADHRADRRHTTTPGASVMGRISPFVILRGRTPGGRSAASTPFSERLGGGAGGPPVPQMPSASGASLGSAYPLSMQHRNPGGQPATPDHLSAMGGGGAGRAGAGARATRATARTRSPSRGAGRGAAAAARAGRARATRPHRARPATAGWQGRGRACCPRSRATTTRDRTCITPTPRQQGSSTLPCTPGREASCRGCGRGRTVEMDNQRTNDKM